MILNAAVTTAKLADGSVTAVKLGADSVTIPGSKSEHSRGTVKILDDNVTQAKIADAAVGSDQLRGLC